MVASLPEGLSNNAMLKITEGVYSIQGLLVGRVYVFQGRDGLVLVDTSLANSRKVIERELGSIGWSLKEVKYILITHAHPDHQSSAADLHQATGAPVYVHQRDAAIARGEVPIPRPKRADMGLWNGMISRLTPNMPMKSTPVHCEFRGDDVLDDIAPGLTVIDTPGHTPGHSAFWWPEKRLIFCGDAVMYLFGFGLPVVYFTPDMAEAKRSVRKLAAMDFDMLCMGHGRPITSGACDQLRAYAAKLKD